MNRLLASTWYVIVAGLLSSPPLRAQDTIRYFDRKTMKEAATASGNIVEETPARVVYKPAAAAPREIAAPDILDITYEVPAAIKLAYRAALADERKVLDPAVKEEDRKKAFLDALKGYQEILPRLAGEKTRFAERHVQYKVARLYAGRSEDDPSLTEPALAALGKFMKDHADGWQVSHCATVLARLQVDRGDYEGARKTYEQLAAISNLPKEVRQECELRTVETMIRGKKLAEAEARLQALLKGLPANDPQAVRVSIYQAACQGASGKLAEAVSRLEEIIAKNTDKDVKALAYNTLGDCYRWNSQAKEALWPYLWVDVIYHQDRQEHLKAIAQLATLFEQQGDTARAKEYRDKLRRETR